MNGKLSKEEPAVNELSTTAQVLWKEVKLNYEAIYSSLWRLSVTAAEYTRVELRAKMLLVLR